MTDASQRMKRMPDDLLTYSRAGRAAAPSRPVNLQTLVEEVCQNQGKLQGRPGRSAWPSDGIRRPRVADPGAAEPDCQRAQVLRAGPPARGQRRLCGGMHRTRRSRSRTTGSASSRDSSSAPSSFSSGCTGVISTKAAASGLPSARRSWNTTAAGSGSNPSAGGGYRVPVHAAQAGRCPLRRVVRPYTACQIPS